MFNNHEWANFRVEVCKKPWLIPGYMRQFSALIIRRLANSLRMKLSLDPHRGLKKWPTWLQKKQSTASANLGCLNLPSLEIKSLVNEDRFSLNLGAIADPNDPEWYFQQHRWVSCVVEMLEGGGADAYQNALAWMRSPPPSNDQAWESYSSSERVVNFVAMISAQPLLLEHDDVPIIQDFVSRSVYWIRDHLEYYGDRTNNHILNNARAIVVGARVIGDVAAVGQGVQIFARMAEKLFDPSGFLRERSSHYQLIVTNWLLDTLHFSYDLNGLDKDSEIALQQLQERSHNVVKASSFVLQNLNKLGVHIGDISPDVTPAISAARLLTLYSELFDTSVFTAKYLGHDWFFTHFGQQTLVASFHSENFPLPYATHGHRDLGSFVWLIAGVPVLIDAGRCGYGANAIAETQIAASGHNTILVNKYEPLPESLVKNGLLYPVPYACVKINTKVISDRSFELSHDGFCRIAGVGAHIRSVNLDNEGLSILDTIEGYCEATIDIFWHFPHGTVQETSSSIVVGAQRLRISCEDDRGLIPVLEWEAGHVSDRYGDSQPSLVLRVHWKGSLPIRVTTKFGIESCAASPEY